MSFREANKAAAIIAFSTNVIRSVTSVDAVAVVFVAVATATLGRLLVRVIKVESSKRDWRSITTTVRGCRMGIVRMSWHRGRL